jgi:hypothetical protein
MVDSAGAQPNNLPRSILAVVVGFVVIGALAFGTAACAYDANGRGTTAAYELMMHAYVFAYATFGCWLCARMAPNRPMRHALILGVLGLIFNIAGSAAQWDTAPLWSHVIGIGVAMPAAWLGGWLAERRHVVAPVLAA